MGVCCVQTGVVNMTAPPLSQISSSTILRCHDELVDACERGDIKRVREIIPWTMPTLNDGYALSMAALFGHVDCVSALLAVEHMSKYAGRAMAYAVKPNRHQCVAVLAPLADEEYFQKSLLFAAQWGCKETLVCLLQHTCRYDYLSKSIEYAAQHGQVEVLNILLQHVCLDANDANTALIAAVKYGHDTCVEILAPLSNPALDHNRALLECFMSNAFNHNIFRVLSALGDARVALQQLRKERAWDTQKIEHISQYIDRETLRMAVAKHGCVGTGRKI